MLGGNSGDSIANYSSNVNIGGGDGKYYISSAVNLIYVSIEGGAGSDYIENYSNLSAATVKIIYFQAVKLLTFCLTAAMTMTVSEITAQMRPLTAARVMIR